MNDADLFTFNQGVAVARRAYKLDPFELSRRDENGRLKGLYANHEIDSVEFLERMATVKAWR